MIKKSMILCALSIALSSCVGFSSPKDFVNYKNDSIGRVQTIGPLYTEPFRYRDAGEFIWRDSIKRGTGLINVERDVNNNLIWHWFKTEVVQNSDWDDRIGKCLTYEIIDFKTAKLLDWGFLEEGNPKSCFAWFP